jgi:hypothetical protein
VTIDSDVELEWTQHRISDLEKLLVGARQQYSESPQTLTDILALYEHELDELQSDVRLYLGLSKGVSAPVELGFETKDGASGTTTLSALEGVVYGFRRLLVSVGERLAQGKTRASGRPEARIQRAVDFRVTGISPGSFNLLLDFPMPPEAEVDDSTRDLADRSLDLLEQAGRWADSGVGAPPAIIADPELRQVVLDGLQSLAPSEASSINWIEIRRKTPLRLPPLRLTSKTYRRIGSMIEANTPSETAVVRGTLREIDLEHRSFELLTQEGTKEKCKVSDALLTLALDCIHAQRVVLVRGTKSEGHLEVLSIETITDPGSA